MMKHNVSVLFLAVIFSVNAGFSEAQESDNQQMAYPPQLRLLFEDQFVLNSLDHYKFNKKRPKIDITDSRLILDDGSLLKKAFEATPWFRVTVDIDFPELTEESPCSLIKLELERGEEKIAPIVFALQQEIEEADVESTISLSHGQETQTTQSKPLTILLNSERPLSDGCWTVEYRYGLLSLTGPGGQPKIYRMATDQFERSKASIEFIVETEQGKHVLDRYAISSALPVKKRTVAQNLAMLGIIGLERQAQSLYLSGQFTEALPLIHKAISEYRKVVFQGNYDLHYLELLHGQAELYRLTEQFGKAEEQFRLVIELREQILGDMHPTYLYGLNNLALLYKDVGKSDYAIEVLRDIKSKQELIAAHNDNDEEYVRTLYHLASAYASKNEHSKAADLYVKVFNSIGSEHPKYPNVLTNLGLVCHKLGDYQKAELFYQLAMKQWEKLERTEVPEYQTCVNNLAMTYLRKGKFDLAGPLLTKCAETSRSKSQRAYSDALFNLAFFYDLAGESKKAEGLLHHSLAILQQSFHQYSLAQTETQRLDYAGSFYDRFSMYLSIALRNDSPAGPVWELALKWKGVGVVRSRQLLSLATKPETKNVFSELKSIKSRMAAKLGKKQLSTADKSELAILASKEEELELELAGLAARIGIHLGDHKFEIPQLPPGVCLVDFRRFKFSRPNPDRLGHFEDSVHYMCFILKDNGAVEMLDLGQADEIDLAIRNWRLPIKAANANRRPIDSIGQAVMAEAGKKLRKLIWLPIEPYIGQAELTVISPDAGLGRLPFNALPGKDKGTYLIEERKIASVAVPALISELLSKSPDTIDNSDPAIIVGHVNYDVGNRFGYGGSTSKRGNGDSFYFQPLQATRSEVEFVATTFPDSVLLTDDNATERTFQDSLVGHKLLHIATHGFVNRRSPLDVAIDQGLEGSGSNSQSQLKESTLNPNFHSGLAFAGANGSGSEDSENSTSDGILYSAEIAMLPLEEVEVAVLSSCETGLGSSRYSGEGLMGIQRAFQVAGAKSTIASYWRVNDEATQMLMKRFYENLIAYGEDTTSTMVRIDALRDAQLWMLRRLNEGQVAHLTRGLELHSGPLNNTAIANKTGQDFDCSTHPRYWSAFVLSGDWR